MQLRLLQYGVQAAPPLKDSVNDLIAVRGKTIKTIQIKTTSKNGQLQKPRNRLYHILAFVRLYGENTEFFLDSSEVYLIEREAIDENRIRANNFERYLISREWLSTFFHLLKEKWRKQSMERIGEKQYPTSC